MPPEPAHSMQPQSQHTISLKRDMNVANALLECDFPLYRYYSTSTYIALLAAGGYEGSDMPPTVTAGWGCERVVQGTAAMHSCTPPPLQSLGRWRGKEPEGEGWYIQGTAAPPPTHLRSSDRPPPPHTPA